MCCLVSVLLLLGPRAGIIVWWLLEPVRWASAFPSFIVPLLGFLFLPWTTLAWVLVAPGGVTGLEWAVLAIGVLADLASWSGGARNRDRVPGR